MPKLSEDDVRKLRHAYPTCVRVPTLIINEGSEPWSFSLIRIFLGRPLSAVKVLDALKSKWNLEWEWGILPMNHDFFLFRFLCAFGRDFILNGGPWIVDAAALGLEAWTPDIRPSADRLP